MTQPDRPYSNLAVLRKAWELLNRAQRRRAFWLTLVSLSMAVTTLAGIAAIVPFFAVLADGAAIERHPALRALYEAGGFSDPRDFVVLLGIGFIVAVLLSNLVNLFGARSLHEFALRVGRDFHVRLFHEYLHREYPFHLRQASASLGHKVINETARAVSGVIQGGLSLLSSLLVCVLIVTSIFIANPLLALLATALFTGSYAVVYFLLRARLARYGQLEGEMWEARAHTVSEAFGAIKEVLLRAAQPRFLEEFARQNDAIAMVGTRLWTLAQAPRHVLECVTAIGLVASALWLQRGPGAQAWLTQLSFLGFAAYRLLPALQQTFVSLARLRGHRAALLRIAPDLAADGSGALAAPAGGLDAADWVRRPRHGISFRHVWFRFAPDAPWAVRDVDVTLRRGEAVGITGPNGAGKSTLADLLLGLLAPDQGCIEVDGEVLDSANMAAWRRCVAYVPQHIFLLDASIRDNIVLGQRAAVDEDRLRESVRAAGLEAFIAALPDGLQHRVGERGGRLSGGQRQRLGIARALYHDAAVLVLDEATSALDDQAERGLAAELRALRDGRTLVIISHREATLAVCDRVWRLEQGRLTALDPPCRRRSGA
jgi:ABC-type multidrug transport system fused ATPase/permease subunit